MNGITDFSRPAGAVPGLQAGRTEAALRAERVKENMGAEPEQRQSAPQTDEYVPGEPPEAAGLYRLGRDEDGERRVIFDAPADGDNDPKAAFGAAREPAAGGKPADGSEQSGAPKAGNDPKKAGRCTGNTDKVDREIEKLKAKQAKLEQELARCREDPEKRSELEKQLAQVENELRVKDTDSYRRRHIRFT